MTSTYTKNINFSYCFSEERANGLRQWLKNIYCEHLPDSASERLAIGANIVNEMRASVYKQTGFHCSAGIAHNKVIILLHLNFIIIKISIIISSHHNTFCSRKLHSEVRISCHDFVTNKYWLRRKLVINKIWGRGKIGICMVDGHPGHDINQYQFFSLLANCLIFYVSLKYIFCSLIW